MVRVNECCCGCSLRTGTAILLWYTVVKCGLLNLPILVCLPNIGGIVRFESFSDAILAIGIIAFMETALVTGILGLYGIQKNKAKYVTPCLYFYGFVCIFGYALIIFSLFSISCTSLEPGVILILLISAAGVAALLTYFFIVIKSCRDLISEEATGNGIAAPRPTNTNNVQLCVLESSEECGGT